MSSPTAELHAAPVAGAEDIERRRRLLKQWRRHSVVIAVLRKLLPALCLLILATIAAWAGLNVIRGRGDGAKIATDANIRMTSLVLQGRTERGQPYLVQAASATESASGSSSCRQAPFMRERHPWLPARRQNGPPGRLRRRGGRTSRPRPRHPPAGRGWSPVLPPA